MTSEPVSNRHPFSQRKRPVERVPGRLAGWSGDDTTVCILTARPAMPQMSPAAAAMMQRKKRTKMTAMAVSGFDGWRS